MIGVSGCLNGKTIVTDRQHIYFYFFCVPPAGSGYPLQVLATNKVAAGFPLLSLTQDLLAKPLEKEAVPPHQDHNPRNAYDYRNIGP